MSHAPIAKPSHSFRVKGDVFASAICRVFRLGTVLVTANDTGTIESPGILNDMQII